jgi:tetratricopeptide (TPR) repeat protein
MEASDVHRSPIALLHRLLLAFAVLAVTSLAAPAAAQIIDAIEVTHDGANALVRIRFAALIQYLRHAPQTEGRTVQVFFQITAGNEDVLGTREEQRRSPPNDILPRFDVDYPAQGAGPQRRIEIRFAEVTRYRLRPEDNRTLLLVIPLSDEALSRLAPPKPAGVEPPPTTAVPATDFDKEVVPLINAAREAIATGKFEEAALALNRVLNLPPNAFSQEAQELIGLARERLGETAKAKAEYELYLKLYPEGPGTDRVKARLAQLSVAAVVGRAPVEVAPLYTAWGSISQYYYGGQSQIETTTVTVTPATNATTIDVARLTSTDQKQLTTNLDATGRWRQGPWDTRVVVRDSYTYSFLDDGYDRNRLNAAYVESRHAPSNVFGRVGRQTGTSSGVLGRFDGGWLSWGVRQDWRVNGVVGTPVDTGPGPNKLFAGASVDIENVLPGTSMQVFGIAQRASGETDRAAVGAEVRYFDPNRTLYAVVDYDPTFRAVNIAMAQGSWQFGNGTAVNLLADYRRTPTLQLTNLLLVAPNGDFDAIVDRIGIDAARDMAKAVTPIAKVFLVGATHQFTPQWQIGLDVRLSNLSGTPATELVPAQGGTGNVYTYTLQAIGTSLVPTWRDILVVNGSVLDGKLIDGWQAGIDYRFSPREPLTIQPMYRYYQQEDSLGARLLRHMPGVRVIYYVRERFSLEGEYAMERSRTTGPAVTDESTRHFWYVGWRWDF